jgi:hypothetical protein
MAPPHHDPLSEPPPQPPESHEPESNPPESHEPLSEPPPQPPESHEPESDPPELHEPLSLPPHPPLLQLPVLIPPGIHDGPPIAGVATLHTPQAKTNRPTMISSQPQVRTLRPGRVNIRVLRILSPGIVHNR